MIDLNQKKKFVITVQRKEIMIAGITIEAITEQEAKQEVGAIIARNPSGFFDTGETSEWQDVQSTNYEIIEITEVD